jgi:hypothetical protein
MHRAASVSASLPPLAFAARAAAQILSRCSGVIVVAGGGVGVEGAGDVPAVVPAAAPVVAPAVVPPADAVGRVVGVPEGRGAGRA